MAINTPPIFADFFMLPLKKLLAEKMILQPVAVGLGVVVLGLWSWGCGFAVDVGSG